MALCSPGHPLAAQGKVARAAQLARAGKSTLASATEPAAGHLVGAKPAAACMAAQGFGFVRPARWWAEFAPQGGLVALDIPRPGRGR